MMPCLARISAIAATMRRIASPVQGGIGDLRADVAVQPDQIEDGMRQHALDRFVGVFAGQGEAELRSVMPVVTARCPWMSTSGVTRMSTGWRCRARPAR